MHACILSPSTYMYTQLTYVQSLAPLYMLSDTHQCTYIHSCVYTLTQLGNTTTQPQAHALYRSFLLQQVVPPGWESGPPSPEVNEVPNQLGIVCVSVVLSVVTQSGHQGAPRIHPAFTFRCFCQRVDCFCTHQGAPSCPESLCGTVRLFALSPSHLGSTASILTLFLSQTTETTTAPQPSSLLAECIHQSPCSVPRPLLQELDLSGLYHNVASTESFSFRSSCQHPTYFSVYFSTSQRWTAKVNNVKSID